MNMDYAVTAILILLLACLGPVLLWSVGFAIYLNRIHSHGWASTRRLLLTLRVIAPLSLILGSAFWENSILPVFALARLGSSTCQIDLATRYTRGNQLLAKDRLAAHGWLLRAACNGNAKAQLLLASWAWEGFGGQRADPAAALHWGRVAAMQGMPEAKLFVGEVLLNHPDLARPGEQAQVYFDQALPALQAKATRGDIQAQFTLGLAKLQGQGQPMDQEGGLAMLLQINRQGLDALQTIKLDLIRTKLPVELVQRVEQRLKAKQTGSK